MNDTSTIELKPQQQQVIEQVKKFMDSDASVFILRGYAGTGKTTMIKVIADYVAQSRFVTLMAPTGRAARVLSAKTGYQTVTIHKAIYNRGKIEIKKVEDIADSEFKFVFPILVPDQSGHLVAIVDEASMVCSRKIEHELFVFGTDNLMEDLLTFIRPDYGGKVIFVGDPAQLPPVGENISNALRAEYFEERGLKVVETELTEVIRQGKDSCILKNAMMIRDILNAEKKNHLEFDEKENEVETLASGDFLSKYLECRKESGRNNCVVICFSNRSASRYNKDIRMSLYGKDCPLQRGDILLINQNNYRLNRMNGEFVPVMEIGERMRQSAPIYIQKGGEKKRSIITLNFLQVTVPDGNGVPMVCMLLEDLLTSDKPSISIDENRALYINFRMRNPHLKPGTEEFADALISDPFYNAIRAKYGYAVTGHKCQGGEWGKVFVDYADRTGIDDDCLRWAYTATTRAQKTLYVTNLPHITPFKKFRIEPIQRCKTVDAECRIVREIPATPFHDEFTESFLRAKYNCIKANMEGTPFCIQGVFSRPYLEMYQIQTPDGVDRFDLRYNGSGIFSPANVVSPNSYTEQIVLMLNDERRYPFVFDYHPSDTLYEQLYNLIRSACDGLSIQITNVVEHPEDYSMIFYMRTSGTLSYIKIYINEKGFVTYAKPMSMLGTIDNELKALIKEITNNLI